MERKIVIYDNACATCNIARSAAKSLGASENIEFVGMHSPAGKALVQKHNLDMEKSAYAISPDGSVQSRSSMIDTVLASTGLIGRTFGALFRFIPRPAADALYDFASRHRIR